MLSTPNNIYLHMEGYSSNDFRKRFIKSNISINLALSHELNKSVHISNLITLEIIILIGKFFWNCSRQLKLFWRLREIANLSEKYFSSQVALHFENFLFWNLPLIMTLKSWSLTFFCFFFAMMKRGRSELRLENVSNVWFQCPTIRVWVCLKKLKIIDETIASYFNRFFLKSKLWNWFGMQDY